MKAKDYAANIFRRFTSKDWVNYFDDLPWTTSCMVELLRIKNGLTQQQFADKVGLHQSAIARLESGSTTPSLSTLNKIAKKMGFIIEISFKPLKEAIKEKLLQYPLSNVSYTSTNTQTITFEVDWKSL